MVCPVITTGAVIWMVTGAVIDHNPQDNRTRKLSKSVIPAKQGESLSHGRFTFFLKITYRQRRRQERSWQWPLAFLPHPCSQGS